MVLKIGEPSKSMSIRSILTIEDHTWGSKNTQDEHNRCDCHRGSCTHGEHGRMMGDQFIISHFLHVTVSRLRNSHKTKRSHDGGQPYSFHNVKVWHPPNHTLLEGWRRIQSSSSNLSLIITEFTATGSDKLFKPCWATLTNNNRW